MLLNLSSKTACDLDPEDFEKLFCWRCREYEECQRKDTNIISCEAFVDSGLWDKFYRKQ